MKKEPQLTLWLFSFYDEKYLRECTNTSSFMSPPLRHFDRRLHKVKPEWRNLRLSVKPLWIHR